jgi:hypothetical protein
MTTRPSCIASSALRFYISSLAVFMWFFATHEDRSMAALIASYPEGATVFWMMFVCGLVGIVDVLVNDVLPKPRWLYVRHNRHFGFLAIAFCHTCLVFIAALKLDSPVLVLSSLWNAIFVIGFSLLDAHQRSVEILKDQAAYARRQPA